MNVEEQVFQLIQSEGNVYIGEAPMDVSNCLVIRASSGRSKVHFRKDTYDYPILNILVRNTSNETARSLVDKVYHKLANYVGDGFVILIDTLPYFVGRDQKYRSIYSFRIEFQVGGY